MTTHIHTQKQLYHIIEKKLTALTCNLFLSCIHCCIENKSKTLINGEFYLLNFNIIILCPFHIQGTQVNYFNQ